MRVGFCIEAAGMAFLLLHLVVGIGLEDCCNGVLFLGTLSCGLEGNFTIGSTS